MSDLETLAFTLIAGLCCVSVFFFRKHKDIYSSGFFYWGAVAAAFMIAVLVRVYEFGNYPIGMNQDGAMEAVDALALSQYGTDRLGMRLPVQFTSWGIGHMSVLLSYLTVPVIWLFGGLSVNVARLPMLICSLIGIVVLFLLCRRVAGNAAALVTLAFAAINPWHIMQSRWALDCNLLPHFFLFSVYLLHLGLEKKACLYLSMIFFGLTMYTYGIAFYAVPLFMLGACAYLITKKRVIWKQVGICAAVYALVAWPIFAMIFINYFRLPSIETPLFTIPFFPDTQRLSDMLFFSDNIISQFRQNALSFLSVVLLQSEDLPWNNIPEIGPMYLFAVPFLFVGIYRLALGTQSPTVIPASGFKKNDSHKKDTSYKKDVVQDNNLQRDGFVLLAIWLLVSVVSGCIINWVNINRINIVFYPLIFLFGLGIYFVVSRVSQTKLPLLLIFTFGFLSFCTIYFDSRPVEFYPGFGEALVDAQGGGDEKLYITTTTQSEDSYWTTEILTQFYHKLDAEYLQGIKTLYTADGEELPEYDERYNYVYLPSMYIDPSEDAVYIAPLSQLYLFPETEFEIHTFRNFAAIYPKPGQ